MSEEITQWLKNIDQDPDLAMNVLWEHFFTRLVQRAKKEVSKRPQRSKDEEDVAVEVMHSFYKGLSRGRFENIQNREELWKVLVTLATRKAARAYRENQTLKRGGGDVRGESVFLNSPGGIGNATGEFDERFEEIVFQEMLECLESLNDPTLKKVAQLRLEGYSIQEIALKMNVVPRTIDRKLQRIRIAWEENNYGPDAHQKND